MTSPINSSFDFPCMSTLLVAKILQDRESTDRSNDMSKVQMRLELIAVPVSDVDRAKAFYVDQVGFNPDHDHTVSDELRFVQLTPPGSACSIAIGRGVTDAEPGSVQGLQVVV